MKMFEVGRCYFMLSFFDTAARIPIVETYIFAGKNLMKEDQNCPDEIYYFKTPEGYTASGVTLSATNLESFVRLGTDTIDLVLEKAELIEQLQEI